MSRKEPQMALLICRPSATGGRVPRQRGGVRCEAPAVRDRGRRRLWEPHNSITSRSSSSLLVSLSSTPVCFPVPSRPLLLAVLEGVSGTPAACSGREGSTRPLSARNPDAGRFPLSSLAGGQGTRVSPAPPCPPEGRRVSCLRSSRCKRAEPGAEAAISR